MNICKKPLTLIFLIILSSLYTQAQILDKSWRNLVHTMPAEWYATEQAKAIAENVLLYQRDIGGWPKNVQEHQALTEGQKAALREEKSDPMGCTTDNGATFTEMLFLSRMYQQVPDERYKNAFLKGFDYFIEAQYDNGGWPQFYPLKKGYYSHITYNDDSMANIMDVLRDLIENNGTYSIQLDKKRLEQAKKAFDKGIKCILKTQYKQKGVLTGWCAQHDEYTLLPAKARAYELPSLSGQESAEIVLLLMSVNPPTEEIKRAVVAAVEWFEKTKITGLRIERYITPQGLKEKRIIEDPNAPPLWARFMELEDNSPFFCDRDGIKQSSMMDIGQERRNGYGWYSEAPQKVLKAYPAWKAKWITDETPSTPKGKKK